MLLPRLSFVRAAFALQRFTEATKRAVTLQAGRVTSGQAMVRTGQQSTWFYGVFEVCGCKTCTREVRGLTPHPSSKNPPLESCPSGGAPQSCTCAQGLNRHADMTPRSGTPVRSSSRHTALKPSKTSPRAPRAHTVPDFTKMDDPQREHCNSKRLNPESAGFFRQLSSPRSTERLPVAPQCLHQGRLNCPRAHTVQRQRHRDKLSRLRECILQRLHPAPAGLPTHEQPTLVPKDSQCAPLLVDQQVL